MIVDSIRFCQFLYLTILLNLRYKNSADTSSEKIQTYIISASGLSCLKFLPVCLYSFYMLFYSCSCYFLKIFGTGLFRNNQIICTVQKSPVFQFNFWGKLSFSNQKMPTQSQLYQNNLSIRKNQTGQKNTIFISLTTN